MKILHDTHTHNIYSHCCNDFTASTEAFIQRELELGIKVFGLSNHIWDETVKGASYWYKRQTIALAEEAKAYLSKEREGIRCLLGAEAEYYGCRDLVGMSAEGAKRFDYMLIPHSHLHMRNEVMADFPEIAELKQTIEARQREACPYLADDAVNAMVGALRENHLMRYVPEMKTNVGEYITKAAVDNFNSLIENPEFIAISKTVPTSVSHPFNLCGVSNSVKNEYLRLISDETLTDCFTRAAKLGVYMEINTGSIKECGLELDKNELMRVFAIAKACGCKFTFGTDSHSVKGLDQISIGDSVCDHLKLTRNDIAPHLAEDGVAE